MGDTNIHLYFLGLLRDVLNSNSVSPFPVDGPSVTLSFLADTSLCDLVRNIRLTAASTPLDLPGFSLCNSADDATVIQGNPFHVAILDCTYHPPKDVSDIFRAYNQPTGPNSKTLQTMGWFPSGTIALVYDSTSDSSKQDILEGRRTLFSSSSSSSSSSTTVPTLPSGQGSKAQLPPSQLLLSATQHRTYPDPSRNDDAATASTSNKTKLTMDRIGSSIYTWDNIRQCLIYSSPSNPKERKTDRTSQQVFKMKIKSQCQTLYKKRVSSLRDEDKFYLETIIVSSSETHCHNNNTIQSRFMVFSRHCTMAKVASDIVQEFNYVVPNTCTMEIYKVKKTDSTYVKEQPLEHDLLPFLKRLYELEQSCNLSSFECVFVWIH